MKKRVNRMISWSRTSLVASLVLGLAVACSDPAGPGALDQTVSLAIGLTGGPGGAAPSLMAAGLELTDLSGNTLVIESAEIVIAEVEFERVETTACDAEVDDDDCEELETGPYLLPLPLDGSIETEISATVDPGFYDEIELEIHLPDDGDLSDADFIDANPGFENVSVRVTGTYNTQPFEYTSDLDAEQEYDLDPPLEVGAGPVGVTLMFDLDAWFRTGDGTLIDPATANKDQPNEELVEDNIEGSIEGYRDDDHDGVPHDDDDDEHHADDGGVS